MVEGVCLAPGEVVSASRRLPALEQGPIMADRMERGFGTLVTRRQNVDARTEARRSLPERQKVDDRPTLALM